MAPVLVYIAWIGHQSVDIYAHHGPLNVSHNEHGLIKIWFTMTASYMKQPSCGESSESVCLLSSTDYAYVYFQLSVYTVCTYTWMPR